MLLLARIDGGGNVAVNPAHVASVMGGDGGIGSRVRLSDGFDLLVVQTPDMVVEGFHTDCIRSEAAGAQARYEASIQTFKRNVGDFKNLLRETMEEYRGPIVDYVNIAEVPPADPLPQGETAQASNTTPAGESSPI